ncbi:large-conductance mechanosensitive channel protein MscL [Dysgonomonas sp. 25]|uniref:large-conductance mechanosensitive channel protein MscL n=1 Tax=Dysgonomonas sp. 25 TaxID=2302933 RepID=UPI0013D49A13|nr:large-conductance mechanosensitive channel protein MscL [Dysgonomonas sp. 25]NDV68519.1 large-conductance mechanosensitive channel protein MscL [Dysgonomonas sp. 25]
MAKTSILTELKNFMMRGNVVDMAVGVIVGGAFGKIVSSLVSDVIMPPIGILIGGVDFSDLSIVLKEATADAAAVTINYGTFLQTVFDFMIIATVIFFALKGISKLRTKKEEEPAAPPAPSKEEVLLTEIRDILKEKK